MPAALLALHAKSEVVSSLGTAVQLFDCRVKRSKSRANLFAAKSRCCSSNRAAFVLHSL